MRYLKYLESWGRGIPRIIKSIEESGLKPPVFIGGETELKVIIYRNNVFYEPNKKIGFKINEPDIIQLIKMNPKITQIELANQLNLSRSTIKEYIKIDRDKSTFKSHRDFDSEIEMTFKHF